MHYAKNVLRTVFLVVPLLFAGNISAAIAADDETPEITSRVARISFLRGEVRLKRADSRDWEKATQNLPVVEGDEIAVEAGAQLEIQFDSRTFLRLSENSQLNVISLKDEGIAVSLPQGKLILQASSFDRERSFFEIDAPQTTVAVQKAGTYRVEAGGDDNAPVRVAVRDAGEARIYSETSGFTLRSGRTARLYTAGNFAGEWETGDAAAYADRFDDWATERDRLISDRLRSADYDKYYDRDIYGAEDLNANGEWIYTRDYGYVWKPNRAALAGYADWSPYRYGQWRWVEPWGWTWVNDEPWGWATYHHGRWIFVNDVWVWTPYGLVRRNRSRWYPALVILTSVGSSVCWYPLPYNYGYYDYNRHHRRRRGRGNTTIINNTTIVNNYPTPVPTVTPITPTAVIEEDKRLVIRRPQLSVPDSGIVTVDADQFGSKTGRIRTASLDTARTVIARTPGIIENAPILPDAKQLDGKIDGDFKTEKPRFVKSEREVKTGAGQRIGGSPVDEKLRQERIYGNRSPIAKPAAAGADEPVRGIEDAGKGARRTGAITRQPPPGNDDATVRPKRDDAPPVRDDAPDFPARIQKPRRENRDADSPPTRGKDDENQSPPITPAAPRRSREEKREEKREDVPPVRSEPPAERRREREPSPDTSRPDSPPREQREEPPRQREEPRRREESRPPPEPKSEPENQREDKKDG